ncbi:hypothetical protein LO763_03060 [Glycomyces sp. A-F 0318]|uniref:hypothetical protein n=1 Tax=Glycomyces amatae TaxID=2881355 RepID=UPI001E49F6F9|nr:hypothetical protein [Glycomyces amatae]MCD0442603.1 hypothetical protein [Glycomyces amatae]
MRRDLLPLVCAAALALAGCSGEAASSDPIQDQVDLGMEADGTDEERLLAALAEAGEVGHELEEITSRLLRRCMEDKGFTVHDEAELFVWPQAEADQALDFAAPVDHVPTAEEAAENGFMVWAQTYDGSDLAPEEETPEYMEEYYETMEGAFYDLSAEERKAWERAYYGVEVVEWRGADTDAEQLQRPEPGGCDGEVHRAVYGEPERWVSPDEGDHYVVWEWGTANPLYEGWAPEDDVRTWRDLVRAEETAFLTCLDEGGNPGWDFNDEGYVDTSFYLHALYPQDPANAGIEFDPLPDWQLALMPEVPGDAPYDYDTAFATEVALAEDFAACADETGYREAGQEQWRAMRIGRMLENEPEVFAWQEEMNGYLATAQDLLQA